MNRDVYVSRATPDGNRLCAVMDGEASRKNGNAVVTVMGNITTSIIARTLVHVSRSGELVIGRVAVSVSGSVQLVTEHYFPGTVHAVSHFRVRGLTYSTLRRVHVTRE